MSSPVSVQATRFQRKFKKKAMYYCYGFDKLTKKGYNCTNIISQKKKTFSSLVYGKYQSHLVRVIFSIITPCESMFDDVKLPVNSPISL